MSMRRTRNKVRGFNKRDGICQLARATQTTLWMMYARVSGTKRNFPLKCRSHGNGIVMCLILRYVDQGELKYEAPRSNPVFLLQSTFLNSCNLALDWKMNNTI